MSSSQKRRYATRRQVAAHKSKSKKNSGESDSGGEKGIVLVPDSQEHSQQFEPSISFSETTPAFNSLDPNLQFQFPRKVTTQTSPVKLKKIDKHREKEKEEEIFDEPLDVEHEKKSSGDEMITDTMATSTKSNDDIIWIGDFILENKGDKYYKSFAKDGKIFSLEDCIKLKKGTPPFFSQILALWENKDHQKFMEGKWFYRPEDTLDGRKPFHGSAELFLSENADDNIQFLENISGSCFIEHFDRFKQRSSFDEDLYFYRETYNPKIGTIKKANISQLEQQFTRRQLLEKKLGPETLKNMSQRHPENPQNFTQVLFGASGKSSTSPRKRVRIEEDEVVTVPSISGANDDIDDIGLELQDIDQSQGAKYFSH